MSTRWKVLVLRASFFVALAMISGLNLWAGGRPEQETQVNLRRPPEYISPGNPATGKDSLTIDNIQIAIDPRGAIKRYELRIYDKSGELVYSKSEENLRGRGFVLDALNIGEIPQVKVPESMVWPGVDTKGVQVPEGEYFYQLTVLDSFNKKTSTPPLAVVVDRTPPQILAQGSVQQFFSPDGDGKRDTITFTARTGQAHRWIEEIRTQSGDLVWTKTTEAPGLTSLTDALFAGESIWDGKGNVGSSTGAVGEGRYVWKLIGADRANNQVVREVNFGVSYSQAEVELSIKEERRAYAPKSGLVFVLGPQNPSGLQSWALEVFDSRSIVQRRFSGTTSLPGEIAWEITGSPGLPDSPGTGLPDGTYNAVLRAKFDSGVEMESEGVRIVVDGSNPTAGLELDSSPLGTERGRSLYVGTTQRPQLQIRGWHEADSTWSLVLEGQGGVVVLDLPWADLVQVSPGVGGRLEGTLVWDLKKPDGTEVPDGLYSLYLSGRDLAGNQGKSNVGRFYIDSKDKGGLELALSDELLVPGGDLKKDVITATIASLAQDGVRNAVVQVLPVGQGGEVQGGTRPVVSQLFSQIPPRFVWAGRTSDGLEAPEGRYLIRLTISYENGETQTGDSPLFELGRARPTIQAQSANLRISPNGDGIDDVLTITQKGSSEGSWEATLTNSAGVTVRTWNWTGAPEDLTWDGRDQNGQIVEDGEYRYAISSTNRFGNTGRSELGPVVVDLLAGTIDLKLSTLVLSPGVQGPIGSLETTLIFKQPELVDRWELAFVLGEGRGRLTKEGTEIPTAPLVWDGKILDGQVVPGDYRVTLTAWYKDGRSTRAVAPQPVVVYTTGPVLTLRPLTPSFSPDGNGTQDVARFLASARTLLFPLASWTLEFLDPAGNTFRTLRGGASLPNTIEWDGRGEDGSLVLSGIEYSAVLSAYDTNGVASRVMATIKTDIILQAMDGGYRIDLAGILFPGNSANLFGGTQEQTQANLQTLWRLAEILNNFPNHEITIRGHATFTGPNTPAARSREQERELLPLSRARANAVLEALMILKIDPARLSVDGRGGLEPLVPHEDRENRWKNRRVEFVLHEL